MSKPGCCLFSDLEAFLNQDWVQKEIGVEFYTGNFSLIAMGVNAAFWATGDALYQNSHYVAELLERGVRVLIYAGTNDMIANWVGNERWTREMWWSGQAGYASKPLVDWSVNGRVAGKVRSHGDFTFATIYGAGHLASGFSYVACVAVWFYEFCSCFLDRRLTTSQRNLWR